MKNDRRKEEKKKLWIAKEKKMLAQKYPRNTEIHKAENCDYNCSQQLWNKRRGKNTQTHTTATMKTRCSSAMLSIIVCIGNSSQAKQMPRQLAICAERVTELLALSSRAFQVRKIDRINTYLAMYGGAVWRLKIISHQHDTNNDTATSTASKAMKCKKKLLLEERKNCRKKKKKNSTHFF